MKFWVLLAALTLLAGCGAEPSAPTPAPTPTPAPRSRLWGLWGLLGEAAENATERLRENPLAQRLQTVLRELRELRDEAMGTRTVLRELRELRDEARSRAAEYGAEARALLELSAADLRARGAAFARKLRKRLSRDHEELSRRWEGGAAAIRALWSPPRSPRDGED